MAKGGASRIDLSEQAIRSAGMRMTRQRKAILRVLRESHDHPSASELHQRSIKIDRSVSLATVYRTLSLLEQAGAIHRHVFTADSSRFEASDAPHHDHLIDVDTGKVHEFKSEKIEQLQAEIAAQMGYELISHKLELYCRKKK